MAENIEFNLDLNQDPQNERTVGELREEFRNLEEQVDKTTQGTEEYNRAVRRLGEVQGELEKVDRAIEAMNPERKAQVIGDAVAGMSGGFQAAVASAELFGVENEAVLESLQRVNAVMAVTEGITAFSEKIPAMKTLIATMPRLTSALKGARVGFQGLSAATKALGIGLLVSAVALLVTHWDDLKEIITDLIPGLEDSSELFGQLASGAKAIGSAILQYLASPLKAVIQLMQGDFSAAKDTIVDGFNIIGNTSEAYAENEKARQEEIRRKTLLEKAKTLEKEKEIMEARQQNTSQIENRIFELKKQAYKKDSDEYKQLMHQKDIRDAQRTAKLEEEQQKRRERYKEYLKSLRQARFGSLEAPDDEIVEDPLSMGEGEMEEGEELLIFNGEVIGRSKFETMKQRGQLALIQDLEQGTITKQQFREQQLQNEIDAIDAELSATAKGTDEYIELQKQRTQASIDLAETEKEARLGAISKTGEALGALGALAGRQTAIGKALGVAQATIDTYVGANKALAQGGIFGIASAASIIATGLLNVRKILQTQVPSTETQGFFEGGNANASGGQSTSAPPAAAPQFNQSQIQTVNSVNQQQEQQGPIKAYVVESEITDKQKRVQNIENQSTF